MAEQIIKTSLEKFLDILDNDEKKLLIKYLQAKNYDSLSYTFDELLLEKTDENKKIDD